MFKLVPKWLVYFVVILIAIFIMTVLFLASSGQGGAPGPNGGATDGGTDDGNTDGNSDGPRTDLDDLTNGKNFEFVGISDEDTVVLIDDFGDNVSINLERKSWRQISWSPSGDQVTVLGANGSESTIFDLHVFKFDTAEWEQLTFYADAGTGVESYFWMDADTIAFTQGPAGDRWLHSYDFPNRELTKVFELEDDLIGYLADEQQFITRADADIDLTNIGKGSEADFVFKLLSEQGTEVRRFNGFQDSNKPYRYEQMFSGRSQREFIFVGVDLQDGGQIITTWSFADPTLREVDLPTGANRQPICMFDPANMLVLDRSSQIVLGLLNLQSLGFAQLAGETAQATAENVQNLCSQDQNISLNFVSGFLELSII